nr:hypothetical protein [Thermoproteota archaeon]
VPGQLCLYHADLLPTEQANATDVTITNSTTGNTTMITDIAISNPDDQEITLPSTSTVVIGVNEIAKGLHGHDEEHQDGIP